MKSYQIYYVIILFQLVFLTLENSIPLENNNVIKIEAKNNEPTNLNFKRTEGTVYINIIALNKDAKLNFTNVTPTPAITSNSLEGFTQMKFQNGDEGYISFTVEQNTLVEITTTTLKGDNVNTTDPYFYQKIEYNIDTQIDVINNNFVIFLENQNISEKFDMKFKFNASNSINGVTATLGFLYLPNNDSHYISLGKNYKRENISKLEEHTFTQDEDEFKVNNTYYKNPSTDTNKKQFAFIFSLDTNGSRVVGTYSFSINSEIINIFLIVSIVIALVFAVITFFLIRRKQSSESSTIENTDGLLKDGDKGENEGKDENEGKEDEEKDEKEEKKENEEKDEKEDDNVEEEKKKIKAAEN